MLTAFILAAGVWFSDPTRYCFQIASETYPSCQFQVGEVTIDTGSVTVVEEIWQYRGFVWIGNPYCVEAGFIPSDPAALDKGACRPTDQIDNPSAPDSLNIN